MSSVEANTGGLIGGSDQQYLLVQGWLEVGVHRMLFSAASLAVFGAISDTRETARLRHGLGALGVPHRALRRAAEGEATIRNGLTLIFVAAAGASVACATHGWSNIDSLDPRWALGAFGVLAAAVLVAVAAAAIISAPPISPEHLADDASART